MRLSYLRLFKGHPPNLLHEGNRLHCCSTLPVA